MGVADPTRGGVLVAGSINTDLVARVRVAPAAGETVTGSDFAVFGGGKGANQAVASARSGATTAILGALGQDDFGRQRLADLQREGIGIEHVARLEGVASGVALILVEDDGQNRIAYVPGATARVTPEQAARAVVEARPRVVLATLELPPPALAALMDEARRQGATVVLNATPEPAQGPDLVRLADVLVVNETEAVELLGEGEATQTWDGAALALARLGPGVVAITLGAEGALVARDRDLARLAAPRVEVVDTTGAGDAFCGALAARLAEGAKAEEAARAGVVAGALAVTRAGAQPSMPRREEIERFLAASDGR